jgi:hypothetical protein
MSGQKVIKMDTKTKIQSKELVLWKDKQGWQNYSQTNKNCRWKGKITIDTNEIQVTIRYYFEKVCFKKWKYWEEMDKFVDS